MYILGFTTFPQNKPSKHYVEAAKNNKHQVEANTGRKNDNYIIPIVQNEGSNYLDLHTKFNASDGETGMMPGEEDPYHGSWCTSLGHQRRWYWVFKSL